MGTILGIFGILKKKNVGKFFENSTLHGTLGIKFIRKITLKHVWILLGTLLGNFGILKIYFFENCRRLDIPWKTGQKFFEKFAPKHVQNRFGYFWERFWAFLNFENFLIFKKIFEDSTLHGTLGIIFSKIFPQNMFKTRLDTFGNTFGHFWNFEKNFIRKFSKTRPSTEHWAKKISKNLPQNTFKTRLDSFGNDFGRFWNFEIFFRFF